MTLRKLSTRIPQIRNPLSYGSSLREEWLINTILIPIEHIQVSRKNRRRVNQRKVEQYAAHYDMGANFPPIKVEVNGDFYTVWDGRHRFMAQLLAGYPVIEVMVVAGTRKEERMLVQKILATFRAAKRYLTPKRFDATPLLA